MQQLPKRCVYLLPVLYSAPTAVSAHMSPYQRGLPWNSVQNHQDTLFVYVPHYFLYLSMSAILIIIGLSDCASLSPDQNASSLRVQFVFCSLPYPWCLELSWGPKVSSMNEGIIHPISHIYLWMGRSPKGSEITPGREDVFFKLSIW